MNESTARESALRWWNLLTDLGKNLVTTHPAYRDPSTLTGREIEKVWNDRGQPSFSTNMRNLIGPELIGRAVEISGGTDINTYSTVISVRKQYFKVDGSKELYQIGSGRRRGDAGAWRPVRAKVISPEFVNEELARRKAERHLNLTKEQLIHEIKSGRCTIEQLEAACVALGMVKE